MVISLKKVQNDDISIKDLKKTEKALKSLVKTINKFGSDRDRKDSNLLNKFDEKLKKLDQYEKNIDKIKEFIEKDAIDNIITNKTSSLSQENKKLNEKYDKKVDEWFQADLKNQELKDKLKEIEDDLSEHKEALSSANSKYSSLLKENKGLRSKTESVQQFSELKESYIKRIESQITDNDEVIEQVKNDGEKFDIVLNILFGLDNYKDLKKTASKVKDKTLGDDEAILSIAVLFSRLLIRYGPKTPGFENLKSSLNTELTEYALEDADLIGTPVDPERHYVTKEEHYNTIEKIHTLPIYNKQLGGIIKKAIIESV